MNLEKLILLISLISYPLLGSIANKSWDESKINNELELLKREAFIPKDQIIESNNPELKKRDRVEVSLPKNAVLNLEAKYFEKPKKSPQKSLQSPNLEDNVKLKAAAPTEKLDLESNEELMPKKQRGR
tara:strand:+ start:217082 stop:217465 length:384 start_codon:yes stop_codon:yes gene_type:complete